MLGEEGEKNMGLSPSGLVSRGKKNAGRVCISSHFDSKGRSCRFSKDMEGSRTEEEGPRRRPLSTFLRANFEGTGGLFRRRRRLAEKKRLESCAEEGAQRDSVPGRVEEEEREMRPFPPLFVPPLPLCSSSLSSLFALICFGTCHSVTCKMSFQISQGSTKIAQAVVPFSRRSLSTFFLSSVHVVCFLCHVI